MLHYNPRHVSSNTMLILRRSNVLLQHLVLSLSVSSHSVHRFRAESSPLSTGVLYSHLQRETIPDAVTIQFDLLRMSMVLLETCRGL